MMFTYRLKVVINSTPANPLRRLIDEKEIADVVASAVSEMDACNWADVRATVLSVTAGGH